MAICASRTSALKLGLGALLFSGAWLLLAAMPVLADGGPHVSSANSGVSTLASDNCAGCHRAHTAQGEMLINAPTEQELCFTCHGAASSGSTADVMTGIQYAIGAGGLRTVITRNITAVTGTTITTSAAHGFAVGQFVAISGLAGVVDGTYTVATVPIVTTFTLTGQTPTAAAYAVPFPTATVSDTSTQLGALRGGGFDQARLVSGDAARNFRTSPGSVWAKVTVGAAADVTSSHLNLATNGLTAPSVAWGNGGLGTGVGATVSLGCASCHNPHGNGMYRILNPIPVPAATIAGAFVPLSVPASVADAALPAAGDARNYTVLQVKGTANLPSTYLLYASQVTAAASSGQFYPSAAIVSSSAANEQLTTAVAHGLAFGNSVTIAGHNAVATPAVNGTYTVASVPSATTFTLTGVNITTSGTASGRVTKNSGAIAGTYTAAGGDYWHARVPWNSGTGNSDAPNGVSGGLTPFVDQMEAWCSACHTRYHATGRSEVNAFGDPIFQYRHRTTADPATCTTCHVSHGSNARMGGTYSLGMPFPDGTAVSYDIGGTTGDSRLLKVDNRGTCQLCHDPTDTVTTGTYDGPATVPGVP